MDNVKFSGGSGSVQGTFPGDVQLSGLLLRVLPWQPQISGFVQCVNAGSTGKHQFQDSVNADAKKVKECDCFNVAYMDYAVKTGSAGGFCAPGVIGARRCSGVNMCTITWK